MLKNVRIQVDLQKKAHQEHFYFVVLYLVINSKLFKTIHLVPVPNSAQTLDMDRSLPSTLKFCDARSVLLFLLFSP